MSKGFLTLAVGGLEENIRHSYALALSIKASDPAAEICVVVDDGDTENIPSRYLHAFDYISELPFGNTAHSDGFHAANLWQIYHASPFDQTIYLDSDMLFLNVQVSLLWDRFAGNYMSIPAVARTFRNVPTNKNSSLFEFENAYHLPSLFNSMIYFDSTREETAQWFKLADPIFQNWRNTYNAMFKDKKPDSFRKNLLCNIVTFLMDEENEIKIHVPFMYDFHTHSQHMWSNDVPYNWTDMLNTWYTKQHQLIVENSSITHGIIHYRDKKFLTEEIINAIRHLARSKEKRKTAA